MVKVIIFSFLILSMFSQAIAFQPRGQIQKNEGDQCWYTQIEKESDFFIDQLDETKIRVLTFDDPQCMHKGNLGQSGLNINKRMINNIITKRYSHADANFKTHVNDLYPTSMMQRQGLCIQSEKYPSIGVMVYYKVENNSITHVFHSHSIQGCEN